MLNQFAPGDRIDAELRLEGEQSKIDPDIYLQNYIRTAERLKLNRPEFYFSIRPSYLTREILEVLPLDEKNTLIRLVRSVKDPAVTMNYYNALKSILNRKKPGFSSELERTLNRLKYDSDPVSIQLRIEALLQSDDENRALLTELDKACKKLVPLKGSFVYPIFRWHGMDNQFHHWFIRLFKPDEFRSLMDGTAVYQKIGKALKWTLSFSFISLFLSGLLSIGLALFQVRLKGSWMDKTIDILLYGLFAIPLFWLATIMVVFFTSPEYGKWTHIFPSIGIKFWLYEESFCAQLLSSLNQLILPVICIVLSSIPFLTRQLKSDLYLQLNAPYIQSGKAKGLSMNQLLFRHALPNALIPYTTILTGAIPGIFTGSLIIEVIFNIPGVGRLMFNAISNFDWPVCFGVLLVISLATILSYLLGDIILSMINPRVRENLKA